MKTILKTLLTVFCLVPAMLFANIASGTIDVVNLDGVSGLLTSDHNGLQYAWEDLNATPLGLVASDRVIWQGSSPHLVLAKVANDITISSNTSGNQILTQNDVLIIESGVTLTGNIFADKAVVYLMPGATLNGKINQTKGSLYGLAGAHITGKVIMAGASGSKFKFDDVTFDDLVKLGPFLNFVELSGNTFNQNLIIKDSYWIYVDAGNTFEANVVIKDNPGLVEFNGNDVKGTTSIINTGLYVEFLNNTCVNDLTINETGSDVTVHNLRMDHSPFSITDQNAFFINNASNISAIDLTLEGTLKFVGTGGSINAEELNAFHVIVKNTVGTVDWGAGIVNETVKLVGNEDEVNIYELEIGTDLVARLNTAIITLSELDIAGDCLFKENIEMDFQAAEIAENFTCRDNLGPVFCDGIGVGVNFKSIDDADITFENGNVGGDLTITNPGTCQESNNNVVGVNSGCPTPKTNHFQQAESLQAEILAAAVTRFVSIYPQPANDQVTVSIEGATSSDRLEVINMQGQIVHKLTLVEGGNTFSIDCSDWPVGLYVLRVDGINGQLSKKLLLN